MTQAPLSIVDASEAAPSALQSLFNPIADEAIREGADRPGVALRHRRYRRLLAAGDVIAFALAMVLAIELFGATDLRWPALLLPLLVPLAAKIVGLYHHDQLLIAKRSLDDAPKLFHIALLYVFTVWFAADLVLDGRLARPQALTLLVAATAFPVVARRAARAIAKAVTVPERCVFIGTATGARLVRAKVGSEGHATLVAHLTLAEALDGYQHGMPVPDCMREVVDSTDAHRIIIGTEETQDTAYEIVRAAKQLGVRVSILPGPFGVVATAVEIDDLAGMVLLGVRPFGMERSSVLLKRTLDVVGAAAGLLATSPLLALAMVAIKLDSPGPVLFRQRRVGRGGQPFEILKLRTMVDGADERKHELAHRNEADGLFKIADDPRITRVGRLLRRTAIDELPQLFNVLRGEMSLVGPRPLILDEDAKIVGWDRRRLLLTPGMTGPWQIAGSARVPLSDMVKIDYRYAGAWSLWGDCKILLRTAIYAVSRRGM